MRLVQVDVSGTVHCVCIRICSYPRLYIHIYLYNWKAVVYSPGECRYYVEFGVEQGLECTTRNLRENFGWSGLLMDGSNQNNSINLHQEFFTAENVADLLAKYSVPRHFDHLTLDIDQNTFWVLHSVLLAGFRPRSITVEINRNFHPTDSFVVRYDPQQMWDARGNYFGASVGAYAKLFSDFGYQLIAIEQDQINVYAVDSAEVGAEQVLSLEEAIAGVRRVQLCSQIHPCRKEPTVYMQIPENISLARPREQWYSSLPLWTLMCQGNPDPMRRDRVDKMLFTGQQMVDPVEGTEEAILAAAANAMEPFPHLYAAVPCGTVASVNSAVAQATN